MDTTPNDPRDPQPTASSPPTASRPSSPPTFAALPALEEELPAASRGRRRRPLVVAAVAAAVAVLVGVVAAVAVTSGGEGGSSDVATIDGGSAEPDSSGQSSSAIDRTALDDAMLEYGECMREHGVDLPDPETSSAGDVGPSFSSGGQSARGVDPSGEEFEAADEACRSILEDAGALLGPPSPEEQAEMQDQLVEVAECMRAKGHDMPDPQMNADGGVTMAFRGPAGSDPSFQEDFETCNEEAGMGPRLRAPGSAS